MIVSLEDELVAAHGGVCKILGGEIGSFRRVGPWLGKPHYGGLSLPPNGCIHAFGAICLKQTLVWRPP